MGTILAPAERMVTSVLRVPGLGHLSFSQTYHCPVKASGLRWICMMLRVTVRWVDRTLASPCLAVLGPSERYNAEHHLPCWAWSRS
jgi:hypothetical protein